MGRRAKASKTFDIATGNLLGNPKRKNAQPLKRFIEEGKLQELAFLASIVNSSDDAIIGKTLDGKITSWNPAAALIFGYSAKEIIGKPISVLIPVHLRKEEAEIIENIRHGKSVDHYETKRIKKDGSIIDVSLNISPILDSSGNIIGASKILRDITDRKKKEADLVHVNEQLNVSLKEAADYKHALDESSIVAITEKSGIIKYVNDNFCKISKYNREELIGKDHRIINSGYHPKEFIRDLWSTISRGRIWHGELKNKAKDGSIYWVDTTIVPFLDNQGSPYQYVAIRSEITARKKGEDQIKQLNESLEQRVIKRTTQLQASLQELKESEEKFQKAFQASGSGITITRLSDSTYVEANDAFLQLTGYTREELIGHTSTELGIVLNLKKREEIMREIKEQGSARNFEITVRHKSGRQVEVISSVETISLKGEDYAINVIYDITARKLAEEQLKVANKELESFSYSVSHDLRAPLRAINGNATILEEDYVDKLDTDGLIAVQSIVRNSKRMGILIDDLLAFSRLGRMHATVSEINMAELVASITEELVVEGIRDRTVITLDPLPPARGDQSLIKQVWINLISNAIKYSRNKPKTEVHIGAYIKDNMVVYFIKDNGAGFDMQYYNKLFGVFQRLHSQEEFEGIGIGLANVQKIVHRHKGTVWAESIPGQGTCFYFSLPTVQVSLINFIT